MDFKRTKALAIVGLYLFSCLITVAQPVQFSFKGGVKNESLKRTMQNNVSSLLSEINNSVKSGNGKIVLYNGITKEALDQVNSLWMKVPFRIDSTIIEDAYCLQKKVGNSLVGYEVRHIEITMMPRVSQECGYPLKQEICIDFSLDGEINFFTLAMKWSSVKKILKYGDEKVEIDQRIREIVDFCDQLKMAYVNKDKTIFTKIFGIHPLVFAGRYIGNTKLDYRKYSSVQYQKEIANVFKKQGIVDVDFHNLEIVEYPGDPLFYIVTFKQDLSINNKYKDCGFICLIWDFHEESRPIILFRSWQPEETKEKEVLNIHHPEIISLLQNR